jgi:hypothetical protein
MIEWPNIPVPLIDNPSYTILPRSYVTPMESKRIRIRRMQVCSIELLDVTWHFTKDEYELFEQFFNETLETGSLPFSITTKESDPFGSGLVEVDRNVAFWKAEYSFSRSDNLYAVTATLEIVDLTHLDPPASSVASSSAGGSSSSGSSSGGSIPSSWIAPSSIPVSSSGSGGSESSGGPSYPNFPIWPPPEQWENSGIWAPISQTDPITGISRFVAIPNVADPIAYMNTYGHPGALEAWVEDVWADFVASGTVYTQARMVWAYTPLAGDNFNAIHVYPLKEGNYPLIINLYYSPAVEYL